MSRPFARRIWYATLIALAIAPPIGAVGYILYSGLLARETTHQLAVPYDGLYWDAAQFQIAYGRFANQVLLYRSGIDDNFDELRMRYDLLESKLGIVSGSTSQLDDHPSLQSRQVAILKQLDAALGGVGTDLDMLGEDRNRGTRITGVLRQNMDAVTELANGRRAVDVAEREAIVRDFATKRRYLFYGGIALALLSFAATALLLLNSYRRTRLIMQQRAALEAEHHATRAAREASMAKDTFLGMISHELRTPLHAIVSSVELLGLNLHDESDRKIIERLETGARHLEAQMRDLTDYARLGAGKLELRTSIFDPADLLDSIVDANTPAACARGLELRGVFAGERGPLASDSHRLRQIVTNLVTNAIKYTDAGFVEVRFERSAERLDIGVTDSGPGIPREQLLLIFREFTQLDSSTTRRFDGAGIGLAVVRGLVGLLGGTIDVTSEMGRGTVFHVSLPAAPVSALPQPEDLPAVPEPVARSRILVIDDHESIRASLTEMLAHLGYASVALGDVDSALAWLETNEADAILADLHMPGKDGYSFAEEYRARRRGRASAPVIAVSAHAPDLFDPSATLLFFDYLLKPVHYDVLKNAVHRAISVTRRGL